MACSITNSPTTLTFILPYLPTTRREVSPFLQHAQRTSDCGTRRTDQLNPEKSAALIIGTTARLHAVTSAVSSVAVASVEVELPVADEMKVPGVVLARRLTF